ncbi:hypothetical protein NDU88_005318 [Pleurodeles waltl]|uniref:Uncharacterized protein n=1 Tax=Pleurodeles waltl TaxID=8319 RepID=A0AAV7RKM9_PLEWA|nr:hypothetical protein NDU88_005318 [Pleurodeles waltl]
MRAASDWGTPAYIRINYPPSGITRGFSRSSLGDLGNSGHNGRGFLVLTFVILLAPRGKQRRMALKVTRGSRLKPGLQERRPLDPQPPARGGDFQEQRLWKHRQHGGLPQVKTDVGGSRSLDTHKTVSCVAGGSSQASVPCVGGNVLAAASEGETGQPLYAPGFQGNVGLAKELVTGAGYCEQAVAAHLLPSTDPPTLACTLEAIGDFRQGREDSLVQGEVGENFFSLSDQSQDPDEASTSPSIDSETCDSSTAPLTPISVLRGTAIKCQPKQSEVSRLDKAGESSGKRKKKKASRTRAMSWDYTETQQLLHSMGDLSVAPTRAEVNVLDEETVPPSPSLHLIYQTIMAQHKQTQRDSKKARVATKQLQVAVSKVAKTCSEIGERIAAIECRADVLESDLGAVTKQAAMHETQLSDIQWKVEDFENRQRCNNLRLIGIQEGVEGQDSRAFIIRLFKAAFPEQTGWEWEEIQRSHRFPLHLRNQQLTGASGSAQQQPRAFIVYFGNYLLRQIVFEKAYPDARISCEGCTFFSRPDFCHATLERRWRLRQLISPFQEKGVEAYLLSPVRLKTLYKGTIRVFSSEIKAKEYLQSLT